MRIVATLLPAEVHCRVAGVVRRRPVARLLVFSTKALHGRPGFDQRSVDGEVLSTHEARSFRLRDHGLEASPRHVVLEQALTVLRERRRIEGRLVHVHVEKPPKQ
jgi:hypothetical protein